MGVIKTIGNKQYQQDAKGDWYEVPVPETNAQTKVVNGRTYQKDQSGQWYDMGPVKKKDTTSPLSGIGAKAAPGASITISKEEESGSTGQLPSKDIEETKTPVTEDVSIEQLLRTVKKSPSTQADADRISKWKAIMEPEIFANKEELMADPVAVQSRFILSLTPGIKNKTTEVSSTFVKKPVEAQIAEKEAPRLKKESELSLKEAQQQLQNVREEYSNNTTNSLEHLRQLTGATNGDELYSDKADATIKASMRPGNETDRLAYQRLQEAKSARNSIRQNIEKGKGFEDMAVDFVASQDPGMAPIIKQLKDTPSFREMLNGVTEVTRNPADAFGNATIGRMVYDFVTNTAVQEEISKVPGLTGQFRAAAGQLLEKYPEFGKRYMGQLISQKMEDMGLNNAILNVATKEERDKAVDALEKEGIIGPKERRFYEEYIRPMSGVGLFLRKLTGNQIIDTPGAIENTLGSFYQGAKSIPKGIYELTAKDAVLGQQGALAKDLEFSDRQVNVKPGSLIHEITSYGGQFLGQSTSIGAGANMLSKLKAVSNPKVAMGLMGGVQAYANYMPMARQIFPGDQLKQQAFATVLSGFEMATENIFNDKKVVDALLGKVKPGIAQTIRQFTSEKINSEAARSKITNLIKKAIRDVPDAAKYYSKGVLQNTVEEDAAQLGQQVTVGVFNNKPINEWIDGEELWETTRQAALGSAFIAGLSAKSDMRENRGITAKSIYAMAQEFPYWKQQMEDAAKLDPELAKEMPDKIANLEFAAKVSKELENSNYSEKQKIKFVINALERKVNEGITSESVVPEIHKETTAALEDEKKAILSGEDDGTITGDLSDNQSDLTMLERVQKSATEGMAALYDTEESLVELQDQALTTPANINEKLSNDQELTTDLIAQNTPEAIKASLDGWVTKMKEAEPGSIEFDEAEAHVALLEIGLEKSEGMESNKIEAAQQKLYETVDAKGKEVVQKIDPVLQKINNAEYINEKELDKSANKLYELLDEIDKSNLTDEQKQSAANLVEPLIEKLEGYEFRTKTKTRTVTETRATQVARPTTKRQKKPLLEEAVGSAVTVTNKDGSKVRGVLKLDNGTYSVFNEDGEKAVALGGKALNDVWLNIPDESVMENPVEFDENGNVKTITFETKDGRLLTVVNSDRALDLAIQLRAEAVGEVSMEEFDTVYEKVRKRVKEEVLASTGEPISKKAEAKKQEPKPEAEKAVEPAQKPAPAQPAAAAVTTTEENVGTVSEEDPAKINQAHKKLSEEYLVKHKELVEQGLRGEGLDNHPELVAIKKQLAELEEKPSTVSEGAGEGKVSENDFEHDLGNNLKTKKVIPSENITIGSEHTTTIDFKKGEVSFSGNLPKVEKGYLYHSTFSGNIESILKEGIVPNKFNNWEDWSEKGYSYFAKTPKEALQWAKDLYEEQIRDFGDVKNLDDITILKIKVDDAKLKSEQSGKVVEGASTKPSTVTEQPTQPKPTKEEGKPEGEKKSDKPKKETKMSSAKAFAEKMREKADQIDKEGLRSILPSWARADLPDGTKMSSSMPGIDKIVSTAMRIVAEAAEVLDDIGEAIKKGSEYIREKLSAKGVDPTDVEEVVTGFEVDAKAEFDFMEQQVREDREPTEREKGARRFNFFKNRKLKTSDKQGVMESKATLERGTGKEVEDDFIYDKVVLEDWERAGKSWMDQARVDYAKNNVQYAEVLLEDLEATDERMEVKAVGMISLLNAIDLDLKYKNLTQAERDIMNGIRNKLLNMIGENARKASLTLNAQRIIHKMYRGYFRSSGMMEALVGEDIQEDVDDVFVRIKNKPAEISETVRQQHRNKKAEAPKAAEKKQEKKTKLMTKKQAEKQAAKRPPGRLSQLKDEIKNIANTLKCGKKKK